VEVAHNFTDPGEWDFPHHHDTYRVSVVPDMVMLIVDDYDESGGSGKSKRKSKSKRVATTNVKPMLLGKSERDPVFAACDRALRRTIEHLRPRYIIGVGKFAEGKAREVAGSVLGRVRKKIGYR
jgi:hypothetical protein